MTTQVYWEIDGTSLHTEAWSVRTFGGSRNAVPERRGENVMVPFRAGRHWVRKYREQRVLDLPMWMIPRNPDGTKDPALDDEQKMQQNWQTLMDLVDKDQVTLTKRFWDGATVKAVDATAELADAPQPRVTGGRRIEFTLSLLLPDPWFYDAPVAEPVGTIDVQGNAPTDRIVLEMSAGRVTAPDGNWIEFTGSGTVTIDCRAATAKRNGNFVNGLIERNPKFPDWLTLQPGVQPLTGPGTLTYEPAYK